MALRIPANLGQAAATGVEIRPLAPGIFDLKAHPNPFNPRTEIRFKVAEPGTVDLVVYDLQGRHVIDLAHGAFAAGAHTVVWDGRDSAGRLAATGTYVLQIKSGRHQQGLKLLLVK